MLAQYKIDEDGHKRHVIGSETSRRGLCGNHFSRRDHLNRHGRWALSVSRCMESNNGHIINEPLAVITSAEAGKDRRDSRLRIAVSLPLFRHARPVQQKTLKGFDRGLLDSCLRFNAGPCYSDLY